MVPYSPFQTRWNLASTFILASGTYPATTLYLIHLNVVIPAVDWDPNDHIRVGIIRNRQNKISFMTMKAKSLPCRKDCLH